MNRPLRLSVVLLALCLPLLEASAERRIVYLQPLGKALPAADVAAVEAGLTAMFGVEVRRLPRVALPRNAWYAPRKRYRAEKLLDFLHARRPADAFRVLGLTAADISTSKGRHTDWGILGLATLDGSSCVVSSHRVRRRARGRKHARERLAKVAVHEIGHTLGLEHCPTRGCLMEDAQGSVLTTDREDDLCDACRERLRRRGHAVQRPTRLPWPPASSK